LTVKVTVPEFTVPSVLVTVADKVTFWALLLKVAVAFDAVMVSVFVVLWTKNSLPEIVGPLVSLET
jgi:hypothetical protein